MNAFVKNSLKWIARVLCWIASLPAYVVYLIFIPVVTRDKSFQGASQFFSLIPGVFGEYVRREFYRLSLARCSRDCCISFGTIFTSPNAEIGEGVYIGAYCVIGEVEIGAMTLIGSNVELINGTKQHHIESVEIPIKEQGGEFPKIRIGEDCWIGDGAIVMAHVGKKSVVGAASLVHKEIPEFSIAVGNPARVIRSRKGEA